MFSVRCTMYGVRCTAAYRVRLRTVYGCVLCAAYCALPRTVHCLVLCTASYCVLPRTVYCLVLCTTSYCVLPRTVYRFVLRTASAVRLFVSPSPRLFVPSSLRVLAAQDEPRLGGADDDTHAHETGAESAVWAGARGGQRSVRCVVCEVDSAVYGVWCAVRCTMYGVRCTVYDVRFVLPRTVYCPVLGTASYLVLLRTVY